MFDLELCNIISKHQNYIDLSREYQIKINTQLKEYLSIGENVTIFDNMFNLVHFLENLEIWSPRQCWLGGCYASSKLNILREHNYKQVCYNCSNIISSFIEYYEFISRNTKINIQDLFNVLDVMRRSLKTGANDPLVIFSHQVLELILNHLEECLNISPFDQEAEHIIPSFSGNMTDFKNTVEQLSLPCLLIDTLINITSMLVNHPLAVQLFVIAPDIHLIVFAGERKECCQPKVLAISPSYIQIINNYELCILLGYISFSQSAYSLKLFMNYLKCKCVDTSSFNHYEDILNQFPNDQGFLKGEKYTPIFCKTPVDKFILPIHHKINAYEINAHTIFNSAVISCFQNSEIPGVIDENSGQILLSHQCKKDKTSWYNICLYFLSPYMKNLGKDIYEYTYLHRPLTFNYWKCFIETAAHYFIDDIDIIKTFWLNPMYWKVIPFQGRIFFTSNTEAYSILVNNFITNKTITHIYIDKMLKIVKEEQHRNICSVVYTLMVYAKVDPFIRSYLLLPNSDNKYLMQAFFPMLDPNVVSLVPMSHKLKEIDDQHLHLINLMTHHAEKGEKKLAEIISTLFPPKIN